MWIIEKIIYGKKGLDERSAMTYWAWDNLCPCTINRGEEMKSSWSDAIASCDTRESRHFANHAPLGNRVCGLQSKLFSARHENSLCTERTLRRPPPSLKRKSLLRPVFVPPFFLIERSGEKEEGKKRGEEGKEEREKSSSITRFDSIESKKRRRRIDGIPTPIASNPNLWQGRKLKRIRRIRFASVHLDGTMGSHGQCVAHALEIHFRRAISNAIPNATDLYDVRYKGLSYSRYSRITKVVVFRKYGRRECNE